MVMKAEKRKVQLTGGSTYTISLPIKWAREAAVKQGDELLVVPQRDSSLLLTPVKEGEARVLYAELTLAGSESFEDNFRILIAHYLVGYDLVKLLSPGGFEAEVRKRIKEEVRKRLIGMEVVGESSKEIVLKSFLKYEDFTLRDAIQSMSKIIIAMLEDAISALELGDKNRARDVIERDNEIDRFYLLLVRQLKATVSDPELAKKIEMSGQRDSLGYRIVVKNMERMGDHVERIVKHSLMMSAPVGVEHIREIGTSTKLLFLKTLDSLRKRDVKMANEAIRDANQLIDHVNEINERTLAEELSVTDKIHAFAIIESLGKIAKYCEDIAEITINLGIEGPGEETW
jgi:phosphate uptake regulator